MLASIFAPPPSLFIARTNGTNGTTAQRRATTAAGFARIVHPRKQTPIRHHHHRRRRHRRHQRPRTAIVTTMCPKKRGSSSARMRSWRWVGTQRRKRREGICRGEGTGGGKRGAPIRPPTSYAPAHTVPTRLRPTHLPICPPANLFNLPPTDPSTDPFTDPSSQQANVSALASAVFNIYMTFFNKEILTHCTSQAGRALTERALVLGPHPGSRASDMVAPRYVEIYVEICFEIYVGLYVGFYFEAGRRWHVR